MDLVFFGSGAFGIPVLEDLAAHHAVRLVVSQPDRPAGRNRTLRPTPVSALAEARGLPLLRTEDANAQSDRIRDVPAVWVVIAFGQKLSPELLRDRFAVNLHASLLPRWRGAAPIHHAVMAGDKTTGVSVITLADRMDAGDVLARSAIDIGPTDTTGDLHDRLASLGPAVINRVLDAHASGSLRPEAQDERLAVAAPKLDRRIGRIDPTMTADEARCRINGCSPWPGCDALLGGDAVRLLRAGPHPAASAPGVLTSEGVLGCADGGIQLLEVQRPGGRPAPFAEWARGCRQSWPTTFEAVP
ncbi:MAG: methionyl-tRNA formyltransferase [Phycisphaerales bacterium]|jgi:methionyl-tRNA formyltransferase|nr:methionyl-tRNA formyltransferase [Phycisphaerales bacterium]